MVRSCLVSPHFFWANRRRSISSACYTMCAYVCLSVFVALWRARNGSHIWWRANKNGIIAILYASKKYRTRARELLFTLPRVSPWCAPQVFVITVAMSFWRAQSRWRMTVGRASNYIYGCVGVRAQWQRPRGLPIRDMGKHLLWRYAFLCCRNMHIARVFAENTICAETPRCVAQHAVSSDDAISINICEYTGLALGVVF